MMKILIALKTNRRLTIRLFGFVIMERTFDRRRYISLFSGAIVAFRIDYLYAKHHKRIVSMNDKVVTTIKICGYITFKILKINHHKQYFFFGKLIKRVSLLEKFKKQYFKYLKNCDAVFILITHSGEAYLALTYIINALIKRYNSQNPIIIATQKYHIDMIKMICPNIQYVYIPTLTFKKLPTNYDSFKIDNHRFFIFFSLFHFYKLAYACEQTLDKAHYFEAICNSFNLTKDDLCFNKTFILPEDAHNISSKIAKTKLNINNFIFLAPESISFNLYDEYFWCELINELQNISYDVFVNFTRDDIKLESATYKSCQLSFGEAYALAKQSKGIISLRSGFTEFLLQTNVPIIVLYTRGFPILSNTIKSANRAKSQFEIAKLPYIDMQRIYEFNTLEISQKDLLDKIITYFKTMPRF